MTREEAIVYHDSGAWKSLTHRQRAALQLEVEVMCMPFAVFHEAIEKALGRPVWTHEFGLNWNGLKAELAGAEDARLRDEIRRLTRENREMRELLERIQVRTFDVQTESEISQLLVRLDKPQEEPS